MYAIHKIAITHNRAIRIQSKLITLKIIKEISRMSIQSANKHNYYNDTKLTVRILKKNYFHINIVEDENMRSNRSKQHDLQKFNYLRATSPLNPTIIRINKTLKKPDPFKHPKTQHPNQMLIRSTIKKSTFQEPKASMSPTRVLGLVSHSDQRTHIPIRINIGELYAEFVTRKA